MAAAPPPVPAGPATTIFPLADRSKLPACVSACGPLFDANGACQPPGNPQLTAAAAQSSCFCSFGVLKPFATAVEGVCPPTACTASADLSSIANWYNGFCGNKKDAGNGKTTATTAAAGADGTSGTKAPTEEGNGGDWLSNHYQWVIMLVILIVGITGIWIGACVWRRRYLRRKDRQHMLGQKHSGSASNPSWGPPLGGPEAGIPMTRPNERNSAVQKPEKKNKKKWTVTERT